MPKWKDKLKKKAEKVKREAKRIERQVRPAVKAVDKELHVVEKKVRPTVKKIDKELHKIEQKTRKSIKGADFFVRTNGGWQEAPKMLAKFDDVRKNKVSEVIAGFLYLASRDARDQYFSEHPNVIKNNLSLIHSDMKNPLLTNTNLLVIPVEDSEDYKIEQHFPQAIAFIRGAKERQEKVVVNCAHGMSRSVTIVLAYLMLEEQELLGGQQTYDAAAQYLISKRGVIGPNKGFVNKLKALEKQKVKQSASPAYTNN